MLHNVPLNKLELEQLYYSGLSMTSIAKRLHCSIHKVVYWMDIHKIKRRNISESVYLQQNPTGDPFKIKTKLTNKESFLLGLGLGIYWGEGEKTSKGSVRVANTDPNLISKFREFLIKICQVNPARIHYYLICFNDSDIKTVSLYWSKILKTSEENFGKIVQIPSQGKGTYHKKSKNGLCIIVFSNTKLKDWLMQQMQTFQIMPR